METQGFKKETRRDITVLVDTTTRADLQLTPGAVNETVEATGEAPPLHTDIAATGAKMETQLVADASPISSNRNFQSLLNLVPGVPPVQEQHSQFFNASSSLQTEVNGQMRMGNNFMIEARTTMSAPACFRSMFRPSKRSKPWTFRSPTTIRKWGARRAPA